MKKRANTMKGKPATRSLALHSGYIPDYACQSAPFGPTICSLDRHAAFIPKQQSDALRSRSWSKWKEKNPKTAPVTNKNFPPPDEGHVYLQTMYEGEKKKKNPVFNIAI